MAKHIDIQKRMKWTLEEKVFEAVGYVFFIAVLLLCFYPFYYLIICTISNSTMVDLGLITVIPHGINLKNYEQVFKTAGLGHAAFISVLRVLVSTGTNVLLTTWMAYLFTKNKMLLRKVFYRFVIITMYFSAGLIPSYLNNRMFHLNNSFLIYVIPGLLSAYNMILVKTSIEAMPAALEESAWIDGAGYFRRFVSIVLPLQVPIIATISLFRAVGQWNDFFTTQLYITNRNLYPLQFVLYEMLQQIQSIAQDLATMLVEGEMPPVTPTGVRLTLTAVVTIPILCVYPFVQKYYLKGIMVGAIKG